MNRLTGAEGLTLGYDANGRITSSNGLTITRDAGGRIATITMAPGKTITYTYDSRNRLTQVVDWLDGTTTFAYDDAGRLTSIARPNGVTTTYTYDNDGRLTGIAEGVISNIALTRDGKGQITSATRNLPLSASQVSTYTYDSAGRLTSDGTRTYTWDLASRMTSCTEGADTVTFTYDAASQLSTYTYDSMGRRTSDNTRTYTWDLSSRLTSCTEGPDTTTFTYDALGHRVSRTEGGTTRGYVWNYALGLPCISVTREGGNDLRYYIYTPSGSLLYSVEATDNSRHDYHYDEMGNTLFLTDSTGSVIGTYSYSPFGRLISSSGDLDNPFTWQGQYGIMDEGNDFYYIRARYYDANTARFVSRDPIKAIGPREIDPYQYAWNNPLKFKDVTGLEVNYFAISRKYGCGPSGTFTHFPVFFAHIFDPTMDKISGYDFILGPEEPWMFIKMYRTLSFLESSFLDVDRRFEEIEDRANKIEDRIRRLKDVTFSKREANEKYLKDILKKAIEKVAESRDALVNGPITRGEHEVLLKRLNEAIAEMEKAEEAYEHAGGNALLEIELNKIVVLL